MSVFGTPRQFPPTGAAVEQPPAFSAPDGIEPIEMWRAWNFDGNGLVSLTTGQSWPAGKPLRAQCGVGEQRRLIIVRRGSLTLELAREYARDHNQGAVSFRPPADLVVPSVEPPPGFGYEVVREFHSAPAEHCTCGIYAVSNASAVPSGVVFGKCKLWGKVIPGSKGCRAEYAYPSELHVPPALVDDPALHAYGVPIIRGADPAQRQRLIQVQMVGGKAGDRARTALIAAVSVNICAASANLLIFVLHVV